MEQIVLWDVKFLDCCLAGPICLLACFCPAVVQSITLYKANSSNCCPYLFATYCCCIGLAVNRGSIRNLKEKKIEGSKCMDCLLYSCFCCCCHACLATQEYRQISRKDGQRE